MSYDHWEKYPLGTKSLGNADWKKCLPILYKCNEDGLNCLKLIFFC